MTTTEAGDRVVHELEVRSAYYQLTLYGMSEEGVRKLFPADVAEAAIQRYRFRKQENRR